MLETIATSRAPGSWTEITARVRPEGQEAIADILTDFSGGGVAIEPPISALGPDEGYVLDHGAPLTLRAYAYGPISGARRAALRRRLRSAGVDRFLTAPLGYRTLREEDWAEAWKKHYEIERVGRVVIRPAWIPYEARAGEIVVSLDPGMAFGTGQHPTTRMCLLVAQELLPPGADVLDIGTGSGILALAAIELGAGRVLATDIEEQAVAAARANAVLNALDDRIEVVLGSLEAVPAGDFGFVFANINAATIVRLAADIAARMRPDAVLLAGGVFAERETETRVALKGAGLTTEDVRSDGEWRTFVARRWRGSPRGP